jgi:hypothetical protein
MGSAQSLRECLNVVSAYRTSHATSTSDGSEKVIQHKMKSVTLMTTAKKHAENKEEFDGTDMVADIRNDSTILEVQERINKPKLFEERELISDTERDAVLDQIFILTECGNSSTLKFLMNFYGQHIQEIINDAREVQVSSEDYGEMIVVTNKLNPLQLASVCGHSNVVNTLISYPFININYNSQSHNQNSALHLAVLYGQYQCASALLDNLNIGINAINAQKKSALHLAVELSDVNIVELLLDHPQINMLLVDNKENSVLHACASNANIKIMKLLLNRLNRHFHHKIMDAISHPTVEEEEERSEEKEADNADTLDLNTITCESMVTAHTLSYKLGLILGFINQKNSHGLDCRDIIKYKALCEKRDNDGDHSAVDSPGIYSHNKQSKKHLYTELDQFVDMIYLNYRNIVCRLED